MPASIGVDVAFVTNKLSSTRLNIFLMIAKHIYDFIITAKEVRSSNLIKGESYRAEIS